MNIVVPTMISVVLTIIVMILFIVLFFKLWGMTNNTKRIIYFLEAQRPDLEWRESQYEGEDGYYPRENITAK
mgnify:CR=1 FL=1|jgi:hypothetical protein|tara:strand:- start:742 stop:957 length:216 start_codon:yes stop_codon:yes gene_type:complete